MYEQIEKNKRLTVFVVLSSFFGVTLIYYLFFYFAFSEANYLVYALIVGLIWTVGAYFLSDQLILKSLEARPFDSSLFPRLNKVVEEMSIASGLPFPKLRLIESDSLNAMTVGKNPKDSYLAVTYGLLTELSESELRGVIAHEMAHLKNFDTLYATLLSAMIGGATIVFRLLYNKLGNLWSAFFFLCYLSFFGWLGFFQLAGVGNYHSYFTFFFGHAYFLAAWSGWKSCPVSLLAGKRVFS